MGVGVVALPEPNGLSATSDAVAAIAEDGLSPHATDVPLLGPQEARVPRLQNAAPAVVSLTFDDGTQDQVLAANILAKRGLVATYYVTTGQTEAPGFLTRDQLHGLVDLGNEIGGHTVHHLNLPTVTENEARRQICQDRENLRRWGLPAQSFAYPYAAHDEAVQRAVRDCGYASGRGLGGAIGSGEAMRLAGQTDLSDLPVVESVRPENPAVTLALKMFERQTGTAVYQKDVEAAARLGAGWTQLTFHGICERDAPECQDISIYEQELEQFADWLAVQVSAGRISVKTVAEVVNGDSAVPVPREHLSTGAAADPNEAHAAFTPGQSAEPGRRVSDFTHRNAQGSPICWNGFTYGANTADFTITEKKGKDDETALRLDLTANGAGEAKWLPVMDLGECALKAEGGQSREVTYTARGGGAQSQPVAFVRDESGRWTYFSAGRFTPLGEEWSEHTWKTPDLPAGTTALAVGLALQQSGWNEVRQIAVE
nr:polysaccharide deacetylase family protein [Pseudoclavibacter sp. 13-3]